MADEGEEQKPNVTGAAEHLNLQVKSQVRCSLLVLSTHLPRACRLPPVVSV